MEKVVDLVEEELCRPVGRSELRGLLLARTHPIAAIPGSHSQPFKVTRNHMTSPLPIHSGLTL